MEHKKYVGVLLRRVFKCFRDFQHMAPLKKPSQVASALHSVVLGLYELHSP